MAVNIRENVVLASPKSLAEREQAAGSCVRKLGIEIPALVDGIENTVEAAYTGWPDRLYVIDRGGRVAYKSAPGPYGFLPAEVEAGLRKLVPANSPQTARTGSGQAPCPLFP